MISVSRNIKEFCQGSVFPLCWTASLQPAVRSPAVGQQQPHWRCVALPPCPGGSARAAGCVQHPACPPVLPQVPPGCSERCPRGDPHHPPDPQLHPETGQWEWSDRGADWESSHLQNGRHSWAFFFLLSLAFVVVESLPFLYDNNILV